ncbi:hypothetical protein ACJMK2_034170 [Sinanodonta woodiana]|uniref:Sodium-coupled monocarboxylate transporter 1 n=1 Tax=Sinanodonta woodiana TaxID=1069815 RepID=A0ABD3WU77_SINWO
MDESTGYSFQTGKINSFTVIDYVLFGLTLALSASIGLYYAIKDRKKKNTKDFLLAGGNMNPIPVALSLLASFMSAVTLLGNPTEMYNYSFIYWWMGVSYFLVVAGSAHIFIPVFYRLRVTSAYEYLEKRFSRGVRTAGSMTFCIQMILYMAVVLYAPSLALNAVTGFTLWGSIISVGIVCTFYTTLGGMKAVLWTDTFQIGLMIAGLIAVLVEGAKAVGGLPQAWSYAEESGRAVIVDWSPDPATRHSVWSIVFGGLFTWIAIYGVNQTQVQRACACPTLRSAQIAMWINFPGLCLILYLCCFIGIVMYAFYRNCDPVQFGLVSQADQLLPLFVMDVMGNVPGVPGLFVAALFSGALSTISSGLTAIAACVLQDVIRAYFYKDMTEERATSVSKVIAAIFGVICIGLTFVASLLGSVLQAALSLFGMIGGPLLGTFILGMFFPWANTYGAFAGLFSSLAFMFWIGIGTQIVKPFIPKSPVDVSQCNWNLTTTAASLTSLVNMNITTVDSVTSLIDISSASTASSIVSSTLSIGQNITEAITTAASEVDQGMLYKLYTLSYIWYSATAVLTAVVIGLIVSLITGRTKSSDLDPKLMVPLFDIFCPFLPEKIRRPLRFGVRYDLMSVSDADVRHTALDLQKIDVDSFFDVEISTREISPKVNENAIWHNAKEEKKNHGIDNITFSDVKSCNGTNDDSPPPYTETEEKTQECTSL